MDVFFEHAVRRGERLDLYEVYLFRFRCNTLSHNSNSATWQMLFRFRKSRPLDLRARVRELQLDDHCLLLAFSMPKGLFSPVTCSSPCGQL